MRYRACRVLCGTRTLLTMPTPMPTTISKGALDEATGVISSVDDGLAEPLEGVMTAASDAVGDLAYMATGHRLQAHGGASSAGASQRRRGSKFADGVPTALQLRRSSSGCTSGSCMSPSMPGLRKFCSDSVTESMHAVELTPKLSSGPCSPRTPGLFRWAL